LGFERARLRIKIMHPIPYTMKQIGILLIVLALVLAEITATKAQPANFREISPKEIDDNVVKLFQDDWFLLTAGSKSKFNPMTISWGTMGSLWGKPVVTVYVRTDRFTYTLMEKGTYFTLCALGKENRAILQYCGTRSGSTVDKVKECGLKPLFTNNGAVYYEQATLVIECKKIYSQQIKLEQFATPALAQSTYTKGMPLHKMYVGEIVRCYVRGK
jgi:flavin reductase (DIM6/NTAB) family NADH-FMN oxidoreductase RutF